GLTETRVRLSRSLQRSTLQWRARPDRLTTGALRPRVSAKRPGYALPTTTQATRSAADRARARHARARTNGDGSAARPGARSRRRAPSRDSPCAWRNRSPDTVGQARTYAHRAWSWR